MSCGAGDTGKQTVISSDPVYIARDTIRSIDDRYKDEISVSLLRLNKNMMVQASKEYIYEVGNGKLDNGSVTSWLNNYTSYRYELKGRRKVVLSCESVKVKQAWNDFATVNQTRITAPFLISGDTLIRQSKLGAHFR